MSGLIGKALGLFSGSDIMSPQERLALKTAEGGTASATTEAQAERTGQVQTSTPKKDAQRAQYEKDLIARGMEPARAKVQAEERY